MGIELAVEVLRVAEALRHVLCAQALMIGGARAVDAVAAQFRDQPKHLEIFRQTLEHAIGVEQYSSARDWIVGYRVR